MNIQHYQRFLILAEGEFGQFSSKTANAMLRFFPEKVAAIIDSVHAGSDPFEIIGEGQGIPIVSTLEEGLKYQPDVLLIGIAPVGGRLPTEWRPLIKKALQHRLHLISGLHDFLSLDPEFASLAKKFNLKIHDLRKPPSDLRVSQGKWRQWKKKVLLSVGTDCNIGKMTALWIIHQQLLKKGIKSVFVGTGQTGILLSGIGVAVDALISDFIAGAIEEVIDQQMESADIILVEGQGAITHMGYSGVTMGLLHGSMPDGMLLCHQLGREIDDYNWPIQDYNRIIRLHLDLVNYFKPSRFLAANLITFGFSEQEARRGIRKFQRITGLPTFDLRRFPDDKICDLIIEEFLS